MLRLAGGREVGQRGVERQSGDSIEGLGLGRWPGAVGEDHSPCFKSEIVK